MSYRIVELAIEVDNERELRTVLRILRSDEAASPVARGTHRSLAVKKIRRRLREIAKTNEAGE
jgi:hypothetical protein